MRRSILIFGCCLFAAVAVCADDLQLKDGSKISGTLVNFDGDTYKVQTSYGFALVRKDQVVSFTVSPPGQAAADKKADSAAEKKPEVPNGARPELKAIAVTPPVAAAPLRPKPAASAPLIAAVAAAPLAAVSTAGPEAPKPETIREEVNGNYYINETYGFRMYKPPTWEVIAGAPSILPGAITAMGTLDQNTYLLIGQQPAAKSVAAQIDATDQRLQGMLENFRPLGETHVNVSGTDAVEHRFRGTVDQKDWSGTVAFVTHNGQLYTIFGMTVADTDLVQIQENVIARAITSLQFAQ